MVTINAGSSCAIASRKKASASQSFRLVMKSGAGREPTRCNRRAQHVDRRGIAREQHGAIEDDRVPSGLVTLRSFPRKRKSSPGSPLARGRAGVRSKRRNQPIERRRQPRPADNRPSGAPLSARARRRRGRHGAPDVSAERAYWPRPPSRKYCSSAASSSRGSVEAASSRISSRSSPGRTASAMPRSRASAASRSTPYFHQSNPPSRRIMITLAWAPTLSIHRSTDIG